MLCVEVVRRGGEAVHRRPAGCSVVHAVTRVVDLPNVFVVVQNGMWRAERLSTGEIYVQYNHVFDALDAAFSAYDKPAALLLYGPPGTGKSYAPKFFAKKWGRRLYVYTLADIVSKWVHETEERLARILRKAEEENAVIVLDEFEYLAGDRFRQSDHYQPQTVPILLTYIQEMKRGVVVATTNAPPRYLDAALRRGGRFKPVPVPAPEKSMIEVYAKLKGKEAPHGALSFTDVDDFRGALDTRWYYVMPAPPGKYAEQMAKYVRIEAAPGVYSFPAEYELAWTVLWLSLAAERQVWHVFSRDADYNAIIEIADEFGAVVFVDQRVADDFLNSFVMPPRGLQRATVIVNAPARAPPLIIRYLQALDDLHAILKRVLQTDDLLRFYYTRKIYNTY